MTFLGKILTVVIFIMSILFMGFSLALYKTQVNWREEVKGPEGDPSVGLEAQKEEAMQEIQRLNNENEELKQFHAHELAARRMSVAAWQERAILAEEMLREKEAEVAQLNLTLTTAAADLATTHTAIANVTAEVVGLRQEIRDRINDRDENFNEAVALQNRLHEAEGLRRRLEERRIELLGIIERQERVLEHYGMTQWDPIPDRPPLGLDGILTAVNEAQELVEISLGSDDGLRIGHEMDVSRGREYIGRVIIRRTWDDHAVGEILQDVLQAPMQEGDKVVTKVS